MATFLRPDGSSAEISPKSGRAFSIEELHAAVAGYIEIIRIPDGRLMILNEDGKQLQLRPNWQATALARAWLLPGDVIVGNVVLANDIEAGNEPEVEEE